MIKEKDTQFIIIKLKIMNKEYITCSAIYYPLLDMVHKPINIEKWIVFYWHRHSQCYELFWNMIKLEDVKLELVKQGFITNTHRFVDRMDWFDIAIKANQIIPINEHDKWPMFSEDLY
jgi:hypothetical protein